MTTLGIFCGNKLSRTAFYGQKIQLILVTYDAVNIVPDLCEKWKRTGKRFKRIHTK